MRVDALPLLLWNSAAGSSPIQHLRQKTHRCARHPNRNLITQVRIEDPEVVSTSGKEFHPIARNTGEFNNRVPGTVFEITEEELMHSDAYEVDAYKRVETVLASGKNAWVYVEEL